MSRKPAGGKRSQPEGAVAVAVFGGDRRRARRWLETPGVQHFCSPRFGGNGDLERLKAAIKGGRIGLLVILSAAIGHAACDSVRRLCRVRGVAVRLVGSADPMGAEPMSAACPKCPLRDVCPTKPPSKRHVPGHRKPRS